MIFLTFKTCRVLEGGMLAPQRARLIRRVGAATVEPRIGTVARRPKRAICETARWDLPRRTPVLIVWQPLVVRVLRQDHPPAIRHKFQLSASPIDARVSARLHAKAPQRALLLRAMSQRESCWAHFQELPEINCEERADAFLQEDAARHAVEQKRDWIVELHGYLGRLKVGEKERMPLRRLFRAHLPL